MIVVFGTICLDRLRSVQSIPRPGGYVEIRRERLFLGGEAANTACALDEWGAQVRLTGNAIGNDEAGRLLLSLAEERNQNVRVQSSIETPYCDIYVTPDGERTMFGYGFSTLAPAVSLQQRLPKSGWFTTDMNLGRTAREAARQASEAGLTTYLMDFIEPNDAVPAGGWWQSSTDWVGERGNVVLNLEEVQSRADKFGCHAVLTDAEHGLYYASPDNAVKLNAFKAPKVVDGTGAGDRFRAAMLYALSNSWQVHEALLFAAGAGALKVGQEGGSARAQPVQEIRDFVGLAELIH